MAMEFEGRTEQEAVAKAAAELGSESFDVEVLEKAGGFFGKGKVRISVRKLSTIPDPMGYGNSSSRFGKDKAGAAYENKKPGQGEKAGKNKVLPTEKQLEDIADFVEGIIKHMGYAGKMKLGQQDAGKLVFEINSPHSGILIGKRGKNLDSLQLLANAYLGKIVGEDNPWRIILDVEGYRERREKSLIRMAHRVADETAKNGTSKLLEPLNPFERRLIHTAINNREDVITRSEGTGLYKRVRIVAKNAKRKSPS